jgi:hypothetical protein
MLPKRLDITLAYKAIAVSADLTGTEKRVAVAIIDSFNRKTGQCDPSFGRIAHLLGVNRRTVIRAMPRIERARFIQKSRHGGKSHRNSYEPNWARFREAEAQWNARQKTKHWNSDAPNVSPSGCETCHVAGVEDATQTLRTNQSNETLPVASTSGRLQRSSQLDDSKRLGRRAPGNAINTVGMQSKNGSREAALAAAERRWTTGLNRRYSATPEVYAEIIASIDVDTQRAATEAEMRKPGAGLRFIHEQLRLSRLKGSSTSIAAGKSQK